MPHKDRSRTLRYSRRKKVTKKTFRNLKVAIDPMGEQQLLFEWAGEESERVPTLAKLVALPNMGGRALKLGTQLYNEGHVTQLPDIFFGVARGGFHGLFIEMKGEPGDLDGEKLWWRDSLVAEGYCHHEASSAVDAQEFIVSYLNGERVRDT